MIPLSEPYIKGNEWKYVKDCLDSGWVSSAGKYVDLFEQKIAEYVGSKYAVAIVNGTSALHISLLLAGVGEGDQVLVPTLTFIAPVNAVKYCGAEPVFMDCDDHLNLDVEKAGQFLKAEGRGKKVKAVIPVHIFGHPVDMEPLMRLAEKYGLKVIEDATESLGSKYQGKKTGAIGDLGCLSFNGNKIITTGGAGMILTNDKETAAKAKYLTTQAKDDAMQYVHHEIGYNYRLTNVAAALGVAQMEQIERFIEIKRKNYARYREELSSIPGLKLIDEPAYAFSNYWFYSLVVDPKAYGKSNLELMKEMAAEEIQARPIWQLNHKQKPYRDCRTYRIEKAEAYHQQVLNLPCSISLTEDDIDKVVGVIKENAKQ